MRAWLGAGIVCLASSFLLQAQHTLPDSLVEKFENIARDSSFIDQLNTLAFDNLRANPVVGRQLASYSQVEAQKINYTRGYARALSIIGSSYWYEGVYEVAQNYYLAAARHYQTLNDSIGLGRMYNNIGEVYKKLEQFDKSLEYQLLALKLKRNEPSSQRLTLYNIGEIYLGLNQLDKANEYLNKALDLAKLADDKRVIAYCYWSYGNIRARQRKFKDAIGFYQLSENIWLGLGEKRSLVQTYQDFALAYKGLRNFSMAESYLDKANAFADDIHANDLTTRNYLLKFQLDSAQRKFDRALLNLYRYNTLKDSLYSSSKVEQINRLQTIYETENRERENAALRAESALRNAALRLQRIIILAIGAGLFFSSILLILVMRQRQKILRVNKQLNEKGEEVQTQAESLLKLNNELQNLNKNLESLVEERTAQVMKQNQRLAEYTFINAHKLRAPIASILGLINLMPKASLEEREQIYHYLKNCGEDLDSIIREIGRNLEGAIVEKEET